MHRFNFGANVNTKILFSLHSILLYIIHLTLNGGVEKVLLYLFTPKSPRGDLLIY
jgi:hypothetical protein